jgi:hypothetical protein
MQNNKHCFFFRYMSSLPGVPSPAKPDERMTIEFLCYYIAPVQPGHVLIPGKKTFLSGGKAYIHTFTGKADLAPHTRLAELCSKLFWMANLGKHPMCFWYSKRTSAQDGSSSNNMITLTGDMSLREFHARYPGRDGNLSIGFEWNEPPPPTPRPPPQCPLGRLLPAVLLPLPRLPVKRSESHQWHVLTQATKKRALPVSPEK